MGEANAQREITAGGSEFLVGVTTDSSREVSASESLFGLPLVEARDGELTRENSTMFLHNPSQPQPSFRGILQGRLQPKLGGLDIEAMSNSDLFFILKSFVILPVLWFAISGLLSVNEESQIIGLFLMIFGIIIAAMNPPS